jgi:phosphoenolpyruvate carboxykinase (ATP)
MKPNNFLESLGVKNPGTVKWNLSREALYQEAIENKEVTICKGGPLVALTGRHTGRSPKDKFIVREPSCEDKIWWGNHNQAISEESFNKLYARVQKHLEGRDIYIHQLHTGADPEYKINVRLVTEFAWHGLFARNLFIDNVTAEEHESFDSDFTVIGVPSCKADPASDGTNSECFIVLHLEKKIALIGGTPYAGEIKKSIFTVMNYYKPLQGVMSMHCSANEGADGNTAVFFGLSGTGKTTLSSDPNRKLIGDDEHGWSDKGVFNYEGGCYAKVIRLSAEGEPEIHAMTHNFGTVLENVDIDPVTRIPDLDSDKYTENTRAAYPIDQLSNTVPSGCGGHPSNIILLTADAFGVLPPVAKLTPELIQKYFLVGYTAKVAGTEKGITEPVATFSACFGAPFMALQPTFYAELLARKMSEHKADSWLINTGWIGGGYGTGERISLKYTRSIVTAVLDGSLSKVETVKDPIFGLEVPTSCPNVPSNILSPIDAWEDKDAYRKTASDLAAKFEEALSKFEKKPAAVTV